MTPAMRRAINAMLDQAADSRRQAPTLDDLARRLGHAHRAAGHRAAHALHDMGLVDRTGPRMVFSARCFKIFRVVKDDTGSAALERWG